MPERATPARLLTALALSLPLPAPAQTSPPALTAAERAQREADRVFDVIKFHTIRSKPAAEAGAKPNRPPSPRAHPLERPSAPTTAAAAPAEAANAGTVNVTPTPVVAAPSLPPPAAAPAATEAALAATTPEAEAEAERDEQEEVPLRLQNFVAPVLTPALQATLGAGSRLVRVRLTVEVDGRVSHAEAAAGVPRRLAKPATDAILQWQFAPLPQARTADVDISFRRD
jgi:hypothetical protein